MKSTASQKRLILKDSADVLRNIRQSYLAHGIETASLKSKHFIRVRSADLDKL